MKQLLLLLSIFLLTALIPRQKIKIIFFGDSITQAAVNPNGYISVITELAKKEGKGDQYEFVGAGVSGNKVYDLYLRMEQDVLAKNPSLVVIYIGVNDVWHKRTSGTGTDPDKFEKFYTAIIKKLQAQDIEVVICTPAVIGEKTDFSNEQDGDLNKYSNIIRNIAKNSSVPLIDLRKIFLDYDKLNNRENKESGILTTDRVHLNEKGNRLVAEEMWKVLRSLP